MFPASAAALRSSVGESLSSASYWRRSAPWQRRSPFRDEPLPLGPSARRIAPPAHGRSRGDRVRNGIRVESHRCGQRIREYPAKSQPLLLRYRSSVERCVERSAVAKTTKVGAAEWACQTSGCDCSRRWSSCCCCLVLEKEPHRIPASKRRKETDELASACPSSPPSNETRLDPAQTPRSCNRDNGAETRATRSRCLLRRRISAELVRRAYAGWDSSF